MSKKLLIAGQQKTVGAYYVGQRTDGAPNHYETVAEAQRLRRTGKATSINRGKAILIKGPRRSADPIRNSVKKGWKVIGQTPKGATRPGFPRWSAV